MKLEIEKNRLDLAYKRNLQIIITILFLGIGSVLASFTGAILNPDKVFEYSVLLATVGILTYILYLAKDERLKDISGKLEELAR